MTEIKRKAVVIDLDEYRERNKGNEDAEYDKLAQEQLDLLEGERFMEDCAYDEFISMSYEGSFSDDDLF